MNPPIEKPGINQALIGHLDTGVVISHPALKGKVVKCLTIDANGIAVSKEQVPAQAAHGTHTAGIICGDPEQGVPGVAPGAQLAVVGVSNRGKTLLKLLGGMDALMDFDIRIACMVIGIRKQTPVFLPFIEAFLQKGILPILPIGNSGKGTAHSPACYPGVLSVGAVNEGGQVATFSGSYADGTAIKPELAAPGVNILSATPTGKTTRKSGTSMACAYVAGVAARLLQARPEATAAEIRQILIQTAKPLSRGQQQRCRYGMVDLEAALEAISKPLAPPTESQKEPIPAFLQTRYIDPRFQAQYMRARAEHELEAIILPKKENGENAPSSVMSEASRRLIENARKKSGQVPVYTRYFRHADVVHVRAGRRFFGTLLDHPDLFACSAVDVSIFEV